MHYLISGVSTLKTFSCLCFSSTIVFFHVIVCLPAVFRLKPRRGEYTQLGDSSRPRGPGWHLSPSRTPGLDEHLTRRSSLLLQTHFSFPGCCGTNDQTHAAVIKMSSLDLAGNKARFLPAVPGFLIIAKRSCSSNNFPYVVLRGWLSSIFVVQIAGGGRSPLTFPPQLALPPQSQNVLVCRFPGRGSAHCDFSTTVLGDNIHLFLKIKVTF